MRSPYYYHSSRKYDDDDDKKEKRVVKVGQFTVNKFARRSKRRSVIIAVAIGQLLAVAVYMLSDNDFELPESVESKLSDAWETSNLLLPDSVKAWTSGDDEPQKLVHSSKDETENFKCEKERSLPTRKCVILSATTPPDDPYRCALGNAECSYAFYLPITALAWRRYSYSAVVLIAGDDAPWLRSGSHLNHVYRTLIDVVNATVIFVPAGDDMKLTIALIGRLFVPDFPAFADQPDTYMLIGDADLIPIQNIYDLLRVTEDIKVTNPRCCGVFDHGSATNIQMAAMAGIGMRVSTWHSVMKYRELSNKSDVVERITESIQREFGHVPRNVRRGDEPDWFLDQEFVSYQLHLWRQDLEKQCKENPAPAVFAVRAGGMQNNGMRNLHEFAGKMPGHYGAQFGRLSEHHGGIKRLDSQSWPTFRSANEWTSQYTDANCPVPGHAWESFKYFQPFIRAILVANDKFDVTAYWHKFAKLIYGGKFMSLEKALEEIKVMPQNKYESINLYHPNMNNGPSSSSRQFHVASNS